MKYLTALMLVFLIVSCSKKLTEEEYYSHVAHDCRVQRLMHE